MQFIIKQKTLPFWWKDFFSGLDRVRNLLNTFTIEWKNKEAIISDIDSYNPNLVIRCHYHNPQKLGVSWEIGVKDMRRLSQCDILRLKRWFDNLL